MASAQVFSITVPPLTSDVIDWVRSATGRFDPFALEVVTLGRIADKVLGPDGELDHIELTGRDLGCTEHPTYGELTNQDRLHAWSRNNLPPGKVLCFTESAALLKYTLTTPSSRRGVLITAMDPLPIGNPERTSAILVSVKHAEEWWFYGVSVEHGHRFSLDHRVLLRVRDAQEQELEAIRTAVMPKQQKPHSRILCAVRPEPIPNEYPGKYCGQEAMRSLLLGFGRDIPLKSLRMRGIFWLFGVIYNLWLARTIPLDIAAMLRKQGFKTKWHLWLTGSFERNLKKALEAGWYVDVISYAQRRYHGQHSELVSGYEERADLTYYYVTDAQFGLREYDLPQGNALLSTEDFIRSFPRYGLWLFSFGVLVVLARPHEIYKSK
jgi:hypothetical protein